MIIKIIGHDGNIFNSPSETNPWSCFFEEFKTNGHIMNNKIKDPNFNVLIMNSYLNEKKIGLSKKNRNNVKKILILWEPRQLNPKLYKKSHLAKFDKVYTPSKLWIETNNAHFFNWPQGENDLDQEKEINWNKRNNKAILISGNKYSVIKGELYSLRRRIINKSSKKNILDLAGVGWKQNRLRNIYAIIKSLIKSKLMHLTLDGLSSLNLDLTNYLGPISDKQSTLNKYKISLVIENSADYISEKLFDALASQNIVVYVGVDISKFGLNKNMVLQKEENAELVCETLAELLALAPIDQYKMMREQQLEYRKVKGVWNNKNVLKKLAKTINTDLTKIIK
jgi:hypothetical protein